MCLTIVNDRDPPFRTGFHPRTRGRGSPVRGQARPAALESVLNGSKRTPEGGFAPFQDVEFRVSCFPGWRRIPRPTGWLSNKAPVANQDLSMRSLTARVKRRAPIACLCRRHDGPLGRRGASKSLVPSCCNFVPDSWSTIRSAGRMAEQWRGTLHVNTAGDLCPKSRRSSS